MAKTRLLKEHRTLLKDLVREIVDLPELKKVSETATKVFSNVIRKLVIEKYPARDMNILKKYKIGCELRTITLNLTSGGVQGFRFQSDDPGPYVPHGYIQTPFQIDEKATDLFHEMTKAKETYGAELKRIRGDYYSLIDSVKNFEDLVDIWPEADKVAPRICQRNTALTVVTPELVSRIKEDMARRQSTKMAA